MRVDDTKNYKRDNPVSMTRRIQNTVCCKVESIVKSRVGYFAYSLDDVVASTFPVTPTIIMMT